MVRVGVSDGPGVTVRVRVGVSDAVLVMVGVRLTVGVEVRLLPSHGPAISKCENVMALL